LRFDIEPLRPQFAAASLCVAVDILVLYIDSAYYIAPDCKVGQDAFAVVRDMGRADTATL